MHAWMGSFEGAHAKLHYVSIAAYQGKHIMHFVSLSYCPGYLHPRKFVSNNPTNSVTTLLRSQKNPVGRRPWDENPGTARSMQHASEQYYSSGLFRGIGFGTSGLDFKGFAYRRQSTHSITPHSLLVPIAAFTPGLSSPLFPYPKFPSLLP